jgi:hypothetical protein
VATHWIEQSLFIAIWVFPLELVQSAKKMFGTRSIVLRTPITPNSFNSCLVVTSFSRNRKRSSNAAAQSANAASLCLLLAVVRSQISSPQWMNGGQNERTIEKLVETPRWLCHLFMSKSATIWRASCSMSLARSAASNSSNGNDVGSALWSKYYTFIMPPGFCSFVRL